MSSATPDPAAIAGALAGMPVEVLGRAGGGANSRVYHVRAADSREYALKLYPRHDGADRLGAEYEALTFLEAAAVAAVPRPVARDDARSAALYSWIEGEPAGRPRTGDLQSLARFLEATHRTAALPGAATLRNAREAVTSSAEILTQLRQRLERLDAPARGHAGLRDVLALVRQEVEGRPLGEWPALPRGLQTLSPADIGFHNALRARDGTLAFVDFEYFGWDDPVKLVSDVLWHPAYRLSGPEALEFSSAAAEIYSADPDFEVRLAAFFPFFGLRWALIVLNEFLPQDRMRREFAGAAGARLDIEERQLAKSRDFVDRVRACRA